VRVREQRHDDNKDEEKGKPDEDDLGLGEPGPPRIGRVPAPHEPSVPWHQARLRPAFGMCRDRSCASVPNPWSRCHSARPGSPDAGRRFRARGWRGRLSMHQTTSGQMRRFSDADLTLRQISSPSGHRRATTSGPKGSRPVINGQPKPRSTRAFIRTPLSFGVLRSASQAENASSILVTRSHKLAGQRHFRRSASVGSELPSRVHRAGGLLELSE